eukprot:3104471-Amphidinium_carterae.1
MAACPLAAGASSMNTSEWTCMATCVATTKMNQDPMFLDERTIFSARCQRVLPPIARQDISSFQHNDSSSY